MNSLASERLRESAEISGAEKLREILAGLALARKAKDEVPGNLIVRKSAEEPLYKAQDNFFVGIRNYLEILVKDGSLKIDKNIGQAQFYKDLINRMLGDMGTLACQKSQADPLGRASVMQKQRELRRDQIIIINQIIDHLTAILKEEINFNE